MTETRRVRFTHFSAPYHEGELAGFTAARASDLVRRGVAVYDPPNLDSLHVDFAGMDRKTLLAYAHEHLGLNEPPPESVTDDEIRQALRSHTEALADDEPKSGVDQLDAMDRAHLEAFATSKLGITEAPPAEMTDDELRVHLRALAESSVSFTPPTGQLTGKPRT